MYIIYLHGNLQKDSEEELIINCHGNKAALVKFRRRFPYYNAQSDAPDEKQNFNCKNINSQYINEKVLEVLSNISSPRFYTKAMK